MFIFQNDHAPYCDYAKGQPIEPRLWQKNAQPIIFNYNFSKYIKLAKIACIYVFGFVEDA